jgi:hypothetical protein
VKALDHNRPDIGLARASAITRSEPRVCSRRVTGVTVVGVRGHLVAVEAHVSRGLPSLILTGLPGAGVQDAREQ